MRIWLNNKKWQKVMQFNWIACIVLYLYDSQHWEHRNTRCSHSTYKSNICITNSWFWAFILKFKSRLLYSPLMYGPKCCAGKTISNCQSKQWSQRHIEIWRFNTNPVVYHCLAFFAFNKLTIFYCQLECKPVVLLIPVVIYFWCSKYDG